jgi:hypothetical protein
VKIAVVVPILVLIPTIALPALLAARGSVLFEASMRQTLKPHVVSQMAAFDSLQKTRSNEIREIDERIRASIAKGADARHALELLQLKEKLRKDAMEARPPFTITPFYMSPQMMLWPAMYCCLTWIVLVFSPSDTLAFKRLAADRRTYLLGAAIYGFIWWPHWLRVFVWPDAGRTTYFYANPEVDPYSFVLQELIILGGCTLVAMIWRQWLGYLGETQREDPRGRTLEEYLTELTRSSFADVFFRWVCCSVLLGLAFFGFTGFFWNIVSKLHDQRYLLSAVLVHVLWGMTWIVISLPFLSEWRYWTRSRIYAYRALAGLEDSHEAVRKASLIQEIQPVKTSSLTLANVIALGSFVLPIIHAFLG